MHPQPLSQRIMTTTTSSLASYQMENLRLGSRHRSHPLLMRPCCLPSLYKANHEFYFSAKENGRGRSRFTMKMDVNAINNIDSGAPIPSGSPFPGWSRWMLLTIIPMILPFFKSKWGPLLAIYQKVDTVIETVECMSEAVEEVAKRVDKIADEVAKNLPEGSNLKNVICKVDGLAEGVIKSADFVQEIAQKVDDVEKNVENLIEKRRSMKKVEVATQSVTNVQVDMPDNMVETTQTVTNLQVDMVENKVETTYVEMKQPIDQVEVAPQSVESNL